MSSPMQLYIILILVGLLFIGAEVIIPGGVLGVIGGLALFGAIVAGFAAFGGLGGMISAILIITLVGVVLLFFVELFPRTGAGKLLTLGRSGADFKSTPNEHVELIGKEGKAVTDLRPAGVALIDGKRYDVVTDGQYVDQEKPVRVLDVEGMRVVVREVTPS